MAQPIHPKFQLRRIHLTGNRFFSEAWTDKSDPRARYTFDKINPYVGLLSVTNWKQRLIKIQSRKSPFQLGGEVPLCQAAKGPKRLLPQAEGKQPGGRAGSDVAHRRQNARCDGHKSPISAPAMRALQTAAFQIKTIRLRIPATPAPLQVRGISRQTGRRSSNTAFTNPWGFRSFPRA